MSRNTEAHNDHRYERVEDKNKYGRPIEICFYKKNDTTCAMKMAMSPQDIFSCDIHFKLTETQASRGPSVLPEFVPVEIVCGYYKAENNGAICSVLKWSQYT